MYIVAQEKRTRRLRTMGGSYMEYKNAIPGKVSNLLQSVAVETWQPVKDEL
jgi:hypothetical protein